MNKKLEKWPALAERFLYNKKGEELPELVMAMFAIDQYKAIRQKDMADHGSGRKQWYDISR